MRLAIFSDIHGNPIALDAVLADIRARGGVDAYLVLGDLAAIGYDPVSVLERLVALPNVRFVRGNTDRYVVTDERPPPTLQDVRRNPPRACLPALPSDYVGRGGTQFCLDERVYECCWLVGLAGSVAA